MKSVQEHFVIISNVLILMVGIPLEFFWKCSGRMLDTNWNGFTENQLSYCLEKSQKTIMPKLKTQKYWISKWLEDNLFFCDLRILSEILLKKIKHIINEIIIPEQSPLSGRINVLRNNFSKKLFIITVKIWSRSHNGSWVVLNF